MARIELGLGAYTLKVDQALADLEENQVLERIWQHDHTVWKPEPTEITNRLGWLSIARRMEEHVQRIEALVESVHEQGYTDVLLMGMGGSSLAPDVFRRTFGAHGLSLSVLDSTAPEAVTAQAERLDPSRTLFIVATKSGSTAETLSFFKFFYNRAVEALGEDGAGEHFVGITDEGSHLEEVAQALGFRTVFLNDPHIGGRFSALSYFGLVPASLVGVDITQLLDRAEQMRQACGPDVPLAQNPAAQLGAVMSRLAQMGRDKLTLIISPSFAAFGDWAEQLVAESTGKEGQGILPVVGEPVAEPSAYGDDRLFVYLRLAGDETYDQAIDELEAAGHPVVRLDLDDRYDMGGQFFLWELATAIAGHELGINPFDQPNVESAKKQARRMIAQYQETGKLPQVPSASVEPEALKEFLAILEPGVYIALQAYLPPTSETDAALAELRTKLRDRYHVAVTVGYGPRFLHSTGQLHKGDAGKGLFVQFTADPAERVPIPDEPGASDPSITFGVLIAAQALGDRQALLDAGRRVIRFHLGEDAGEALTRLTADF